MAVVVQFHCVVPVIEARVGRKNIVARRFGGKFLVGSLRNPSRRDKALAFAVIEITRVKALVLARQVIGNEVHNHFHAFFVDTLDQSLKVGHRTQIGVNGAIICDGVGRACTAFGNVWMRAYRFGSVFQNTRQPNVRYTQVFQGVESNFVNVVESATAVFSFAAIEMKVGLLVAEQSGKKLIDVHTAKLGKNGQVQTTKTKMYYFCTL